MADIFVILHEKIVVDFVGNFMHSYPASLEIVGPLTHGLVGV